MQKGRKKTHCVQIAFRLRSDCVQIAFNCVQVAPILRKFGAKKTTYFRLFWCLSRLFWNLIGLLYKTAFSGVLRCFFSSTGEIMVWSMAIQLIIWRISHATTLHSLVENGFQEYFEMLFARIVSPHLWYSIVHENLWCPHAENIRPGIALNLSIKFQPFEGDQVRFVGQHVQWLHGVLVAHEPVVLWDLERWDRSGCETGWGWDPSITVGPGWTSGLSLCTCKWIYSFIYVQQIYKYMWFLMER